MDIDEQTMRDVEAQPFYHGYLPREDIANMLKEIGDFVMRITQPQPGDPKQFVISVRISRESADSVRHIVLTRVKRDNGCDWIALEQDMFSSVNDLVEAYVSSGRPINPGFKLSSLIRAIKRKRWEYLHSDVVLKELLGEGQFGEVRAGQLKKKGKRVDVAVKIAKAAKDMKELEKAKQKVMEMMHEARLMRYFKHLNVVRMYGVAVCRDPLMIILEKVNGGSLFDLLDRKKGQISDTEKTENMTLGAAKGLAYMHRQGCIHRDIASRNVLYTDRKVAKISDFGMSRHTNTYKVRRGTHQHIPIKWTAPETLTTLNYTQKTDVFSFSILIWEIFSDAAEPYEGLSYLEVKKMVCGGERMQKPAKCPDEMYKLMCRCWEQNADKRITMNEVVESMEKNSTSQDSVPDAKIAGSKCRTPKEDNEENESESTYSRSASRRRKKSHSTKSQSRLRQMKQHNEQHTDDVHTCGPPRTSH